MSVWYDYDNNNNNIVIYIWFFSPFPPRNVVERTAQWYNICKPLIERTATRTMPKRRDRSRSPSLNTILFSFYYWTAVFFIFVELPDSFVLLFGFGFFRVFFFFFLNIFCSPLQNVIPVVSPSARNECSRKLTAIVNTSKKFVWKSHVKKKKKIK